MRRLFLAAWCLFVSAPVYPGAHDNFGKVPEKYNAELSAEIAQFLETYAEAYNIQDFETLLGMWDGNFAEPIYMAEEVDPPLHGWDRINKYFNPVPGVQILDGIRNEYTEVRASYLSDDIAVATYRLDFDIKVVRQEAMSSWDRILAVFRKVDGDWKLVAYAEAPMAPLTMVRRMLHKAVPDDFDEFIKNHQPKKK